MMVTEYTIRTMSRRAAGDVAWTLTSEGISFRHDYSGGLVAAYITVAAPSEDQVAFLKKHFKFTTRRIDTNQYLL